jgi:hypothetical protein
LKEYSASNGSYPLDGIGQHIYIDQGRVTTSEHLTQYLDWVRQAYTKYEGDDTPKKVFITELGWTTSSVSPDAQAANLETAFQTIEATSWVATIIWFNWQDGGVLRYGVADSSGNPKPSYYPYRYYQTYEGRFDDRTNHDGIVNYYNDLGQSVLGNPYDNGASGWVHAAGNGFIQNFAGGSHGTLAIMSSDAGTFEVNDTHGMWGYYSANDDIYVLGYPVSNEYTTDCGTRQDFQAGYLTWDSLNGIREHSS